VDETLETACQVKRVVRVSRSRRWKNGLRMIGRDVSGARVSINWGNSYLISHCEHLSLFFRGFSQHPRHAQSLYDIGVSACMTHVTFAPLTVFTVKSDAGYGFDR